MALEQAEQRCALGLQLAALEAYLDERAPRLYQRAMVWTYELFVQALRAYARDGIDAGEAKLTAAIFRPGVFRNTGGPMWAFTWSFLYRALHDGAAAILQKPLTDRDRRVELCEMVKEVRTQLWPIPGPDITVEGLPTARTPLGFAKAALGKYFMPTRSGDRGRDRRSVGTSLRAFRTQLRKLDDLPEIREGLTRLFARQDISPSAMMVPLALSKIVRVMRL